MATPTSIPTRRLYWTATALFSLMFVFSAVYGVVDLMGSYREYRHLEFPAWLVIPLSVAKLLGVATILSSNFLNTPRTLKDFAFAGFLFDLLLALGAHTAQQEVKVVLPTMGLVLWVFAFVMDRKVFGSAVAQPDS